MVFQSTLPIQGETETLFKDSADKVFQSTLPIQGETTLCHADRYGDGISIHSPYTGRDVIAKWYIPIL